MAPSCDRPEVTLALPAPDADVALANELGIRPVPRDPDSWQLVRGPTELQLHSPVAIGPLHIAVSLSSGPVARRLKTSRRDDPMLRAMGLPRRQAPLRVFDATAGLCRDALVVAHHGGRVEAVERIAALVMLVRTAIAGTSFVERLRIETGEAEARLAVAPPPDVVYLDPMFVEEGAAAKTAQVKKDMQVCRALAGPPHDAAALFRAAMRTARERVVCKRPHDGEPLGGKPSFVVDGERVRFDVYLTGTRST